VGVATVCGGAGDVGSTGLSHAEKPREITAKSAKIKKFLLKDSFSYRTEERKNGRTEERKNGRTEERKNLF
jgi:hypothetical protein